MLNSATEYIRPRPCAYTYSPNKFVFCNCWVTEHTVHEGIEYYMSHSTHLKSELTKQALRYNSNSRIHIYGPWAQLLYGSVSRLVDNKTIIVL